MEEPRQIQLNEVLSELKKSVGYHMFFESLIFTLLLFGSDTDAKKCAVVTSRFALSSRDRELFMNPELGSFASTSQVPFHRRGIEFKPFIDAVIKTFPLENQKTLRARIDDINLGRRDRELAMRGQMAAESRIAEALLVVAEAAGLPNPHDIFQREVFLSFLEKCFGYPIISDLILTQFMEPANGSFKEAAQELNWYSNTRNCFERLEGFYPEQDQPELRLRLSQIGISAREAETARDGRRSSQGRMAAMLLVLARAAQVEPVESVLTTSGFKKFFEKISGFPIATNVLRGEFMSSSGTYSALTKEIRGWYDTPKAIDKIVSLFPDEKRSEIRRRLLHIGLKKRDHELAQAGSLVSQKRLSSAFLVLAAFSNLKPPEVILKRAEFIRWIYRMRSGE